MYFESTFQTTPSQRYTYLWQPSIQVSSPWKVVLCTIGCKLVVFQKQTWDLQWPNQNKILCERHENIHYNNDRNNNSYLHRISSSKSWPDKLYSQLQKKVGAKWVQGREKVTIRSKGSDRSSEMSLCLDFGGSQCSASAEKYA